MSKRKPTQQQTPPGPIVETRGRKRLSPDGEPRDQKLVILLTKREREGWTARHGRGMLSQRAARRGLHSVCSAIAVDSDH